MKERKKKSSLERIGMTEYHPIPLQYLCDASAEIMYAMPASDCSGIINSVLTEGKVK